MKKKVIKYILQMIIVISMVTPLIYSFTFFNGFAGQIKPTDYPQDWYDVNKFLNNDSQDFKVLFFPWHGYMNFSWVNNTDKRIANPAKNFFDKAVISGTTVEIGKIYRHDSDPVQLYVDDLLLKRDGITNFGELISILNVKYIILTKEGDYEEYFFLFDQPDLELIKETENIYVFKNKNNVSRIYQTDDIANITDKVTVDYKEINPVKFELSDVITKKYLVFTETYSEDWKLDGVKPINVSGLVNVYESKGKEIRFERFYKINLPAYMISLTTFIILIVWYIKK